MKRTLLFASLLMIFLFGTANGQVDSVYLTADSGYSVVGDVIYMRPLGGGDVKIGVNAYNETAIAALTYPFIELCGVAQLDPAKNNGATIPKCYLGGRVHQIGWGVMAFGMNMYPLFRLGATAMLAPPLMPGDGYIARLTFTMPFGAQDTCICLDTLFHPPSLVLTHVDTLARGYTPEWTAKCFDIKRRPPSPPIVTCPPTLTGYTESSVSYYISANDPDGDQLTVANIFFMGDSCGTLSITGTEPVWTVTFNTIGCTAGTYTVCVEITDEWGESETCCTEITLESFFITATIDPCDHDNCFYPAEVAELSVNVFSGVDIGGFKLYIEYDPTVMSFLGVDRGDLIDDFDGYYDEYNHVPRYFFQYFNTRMLPCKQQCETYKIKIVGIADMPDDWITGPLLAGEGELLKLRFKVANDANLQDLCLPVKWEFDYDFDLKAPSFSSASGESLYVDVDWPGELTGPNYGIFPIVTFVDGGVQVCSDAYCWTGDLNLNEYPYEIGDAILYINYFIYGIEALDIDRELQILASDVNKDGVTLTISDLVFLIRIILEDVWPKHKLAPSDDLVDVTLTAQADVVKVTSNSNITIGAGLYLFRHNGEVKNLKMQTDMDVKYHDANGELRVLVYSLDGKAISAGVTELFSFEAQDVELVQVEAVDFYGSNLKSTITTKVLPTKFAMMNNYPNPFNLSTNISFALPQDSKVSLKLYNIAGQLVKAFEGEYEAGNHTITWDGSNQKGETVASGIYFYKLVAGDYSATKKMVLTK